MKKISLVSTFYNKKGGTSTFVKNIEKEFSKDPQIETTLISPDSNGKAWPKSKILIAIKTWLALNKIKPDEVHCHCTWYLQLGALLFLAFNQKSKVIAFKHSDVDLSKKNSISGRIQTLIDLKSSKIIFISEYLRKRWVQSISKKYESSASIKCGINPQPTHKKETKTKAKNITYVGLFEYPGKVKGLELLIESFSEYCKKHKDTTTSLNIIGDGRFRDKIELKVEYSGVSDQIKIFDNIDNPSQFYINSNLHCHITYQDAMPIVILEALSFKTPVLASNICGIPEINAEGLFLIENDKEKISSAINEIISNSHKVRLSKEHSWSAIASRILKITSEQNSVTHKAIHSSNF